MHLHDFNMRHGRREHQSRRTVHPNRLNVRASLPPTTHAIITGVLPRSSQTVRASMNASYHSIAADGSAHGMSTADEGAVS